MLNQFTQQELRDLLVAHSPERLDSYIDATATLLEAFELYVYNTVVASRFHGSIQAAEVGLRNACHRELTTFLGGTWYQDTSFLAIDPELKGMIKSARRHGTAAADVVANLPLSFWTRLFDPTYDPWLWSRVLCNVLGSLAPTSSGPIYSELEHFRKLRNRIAHLEPLHSRNLVDDVDRVARILSWIDPTIDKWAREYDAVSSVVNAGILSGAALQSF